MSLTDSRHRGVRKHSPYTVPFFSQVIAIAQRQTLLKFQDKFSVYTGYATSIVIALVVGSVYFRLPETAAGAFTRGGLLFLGLLFNVRVLLVSCSRPGFDIFLRAAFADDGTVGLGFDRADARPILYRQVGYRFYRPAAFAVAAGAADVPFNITNIFFFTIVLYFMGGLYASAGAYFMFFLFVFTTFMVMAGFFRTLGVATTDYNVAARLASVFISIMSLILDT